MVKVIKKEVQNRCLQTGSFQSGMVAQQTGSCVKSRVRHPPLAHIAIVVGYVLDQPVNSVKSIGAFVHISIAIMGVRLINYSSLL